MKTGIRFLVFVFAVCLLGVSGTAFGNDMIAQGDALYDKHGVEDLKAAADLYQKVLDAEPGNYEACWKLARSLRDYGEESKRANLPNFEDICAEYGKKAMEAGKKATELNPAGVEGYYYYGISVGIYSDGVSILTAMSEGLKDITQTNLEKAYQIDKTFHNGGPILALGRFWYVLPWPVRDYDIAIQYLREYQKTEWFNSKPEGKIYLAEALLRNGASGDEKKEAFGFLEELSASQNPYFANWAKKLMEEYK